jgi:hypothetical protein
MKRQCATNASHTGRELELMLTRVKPLAHFSDCYPPEPSEEIIPGEAFAPYVHSGQLEERLFVSLEDHDTSVPQVRGVYHALYALAGEAWRIDAYIAMLEDASEVGWNERFERLQGSLLGYTDRENDLHIARLLTGPMVERWPWLARLASTQPQRSGTSNKSLQRTREG